MEDKVEAASQIKKLRGFLKPNFFKVVVAYILFFLILTFNDAFYWCVIIKRSEYCPENFIQIYFW